MPIGPRETIVSQETNRIKLDLATEYIWLLWQSLEMNLVKSYVVYVYIYIIYTYRLLHGNRWIIMKRIPLARNKSAIWLHFGGLDVIIWILSSDSGYTTTLHWASASWILLFPLWGVTCGPSFGRFQNTWAEKYPIQSMFEKWFPFSMVWYPGWWLNQPIWKICSSKWVHLP